MRRRDFLVTLPAVLTANKAASGKAPQIKITDIESFTVHVPPDGGKADSDVVYTYSVIRVRTDCGSYWNLLILRFRPTSSITG